MWWPGRACGAGGWHPGVSAVRRGVRRRRAGLAAWWARVTAVAGASSAPRSALQGERWWRWWAAVADRLVRLAAVGLSAVCAGPWRAPRRLALPRAEDLARRISCGPRAGLWPPLCPPGAGPCCLAAGGSGAPAPLLAHRVLALFGRLAVRAVPLGLVAVGDAGAAGRLRSCCCWGSRCLAARPSCARAVIMRAGALGVAAGWAAGCAALRGPISRSSMLGSGLSRAAVSSAELPPGCWDCSRCVEGL